MATNQSTRIFQTLGLGLTFDHFVRNLHHTEIKQMEQLSSLCCVREYASISANKLVVYRSSVGIDFTNVS